MLAIYRNFPLFLFLVWLLATLAVVIGSAWGRLDKVPSWRPPSPRALEQEALSSVRTLWNFGSLFPATPASGPIDGATPASSSTPLDPLEVQEISTPLLGAPARGSATNHLSGLNFVGHGRRMEVILRSSNPIARIDWFNMDSRTGLITAIDLPGIWTTELPEHYRSESGPVTRFVLGEHPDRLRLSFYFKKPFSGRRVPDFERVQNGVKVTFDLPSGVVKPRN